VKKAATKALGVTVAVFALSALIMSRSEPPPRPEEKAAAPEAARPPETTAPQPAVPLAEPAEPVVQPLVAWIEAEPEEGEAPLKVQFTALHPESKRIMFWRVSRSMLALESRNRCASDEADSQSSASSRRRIVSRQLDSVTGSPSQPVC